MHLALHLPDDLVHSTRHLNTHQAGGLLLLVGVVMICGGRMTSYSRWNLTRWLSADSEEQEISGFMRYIIIMGVLIAGVYLLASPA